MQKKINNIRTWAEDDLVGLARQGSEPAFTELMRRTRLSSLKLAYSILRDVPEAEDQVQNAYWKAYQHISEFHGDSKFSTWLTRIVVNQCLMRLRQSRRARLVHIDDIAMGEERGTLDLLDPSKSPEEKLGGMEVAEVIEKEIRRIPPLLRKAFILREVNDLPIPEVAERLGISVAAAKSRLLRARQELRSRVVRHCGRSGLASLTA